MRRRSIALFSVAIVLLYACKKEQPTATASRAEATGPTCRASTVMPSTSAPELGCAAPPSTFDSSSFFATGASSQVMSQAGPTFDSWAWSSFAAMNWPAKVDAGQPTGYLRGVPDLGQSFANASGTQVAVWETFKEKREVFNNTVTASGWQSLTYSPDQTIEPQGGQVKACSTQAAERAAKLPGGAHRRVLQSAKLGPTLLIGPNALDETAEVSSPAQESQNALCAGYTTTTTPTAAECQQTFVAYNGNAGATFPPTVMNPRPGVGPRVYDPNNNLIYYEVRLNYDYFNYVLANNLNFVNPPSGSTPGGTPSINPPYSLPWRTSTPTPPLGGSGNPTQQRNSTINYDPNAVVTTYGTSPATPPPVGSIQVKSAWMLNPSPASAFHTTEAVYFQTDTSDPGNVCYDVGLFGLIALHIIQRVHMGSSSDANAQPVGGTFIFATWEHNSIGNGSGYKYVSFLSSGGADQTNPTPYPNFNASPPQSIGVNRQQSYPLDSTNGVTNAVYSQLPANSVWKNYRLIGTQFYTNVNPATSLQYNQPYYLANLVVETNNGLQNFQGLPPGVTVNAQYNPPPPNSKFTNTTTSYNPTVPNVSWNGNPYNMGGCMGCHGVAQLLGSNFSFVLLDGQRGAGIDTPTTVAIPPSPPTSTSTSTPATSGQSGR